MADLHQHNNNIHHRQHVPLSISHQNNHLPHMFHQSHSHSASDLGLGFLPQYSHNPSCNDDANLGFIVADSGTRFESDDDGYCDEEASFHLGWDAFHLEDEITNPNLNPNPNSISNANANAYVNEDFEWEEVDDQIDDEREALSMFFGLEPDDDASVSPVLLIGFAEVAEQPRDQHDALEWQVLSNVQTFEPNLDSDDQEHDQYDEYNYTEYEMFFGQFADSDVVPSSGRPPASKTAVVSLSTVVVTQEDAVNDNALCAVCKDGMVVGEMATQLPCGHRYHGECILPWLAVRNTCPVCRHELPTDDPDYERRKAERGG
ncbi:putative transcription factor C2H2 family [Helianthus annuus]|uniref:E3 ubiquitin-protein ligase CIP8-like n=1 Tax=Helianthus annuus TaxID=4232 RepID=UPI000B8F2A26|nr:E3 ubiquitin-protein ligase CIP8-like [Helianthus annuus]KAJ0440920.1 putative transcription factor C2H2 family [Helianthus annuus]KAJ0459000.1 putative transcription factor C2H2 family [Helianthus annuus]